MDGVSGRLVCLGDGVLGISRLGGTAVLGRDLGLGGWLGVSSSAVSWCFAVVHRVGGARGGRGAVGDKSVGKPLRTVGSC